MIVSRPRVSRLLTRSEFQFSWYCNVEKTIFWTRPSPLGQFFEVLRVMGQGRRGEAVYAHAGISLIRGRNVQLDLCVLEQLTDLDNNKERGWTELRSRSDEATLDWERRFVELGPNHARQVAWRSGEELLARTEHVRHAVNTLLIQLGRLDDLYAVHSKLLAECSHQERRRAEILHEWPWVMMIPDDEILYPIATLAVARYTFGSNEYGVDPLHDEKLMWLIQLLVDEIAIRSSIGL